MPDIGLVLSGGMAKGAYQIGALNAINEIFKPAEIACVSAASVGAVNAYIYLTDNLDKGAELWRDISGGNHRRWITALLKSCFIGDAIKTLVHKQVAGTFYIPLVNLKKRKLSYVDIGKIPLELTERYLRASVSLPIYSEGILIDGEVFYDGALVDNIPMYPIWKHKLDYIICVYFDNFNYTFENHYFDNKIIKIIFSDNKIVSNSVCFEAEAIKRMIDEGYRKTKRVLDYVFRDDPDNLDDIYSRIEDINAVMPGSLRITGDIAVNNMQKIAKKFIKRLEIL